MATQVSPGASIATRIDPARLLADLHALRGFGATGTGVVRRALSAPDVASRVWLAARYEQAGLVAVTDRYGNLFGCDRRHARAILVGSHGDTQPQGGWLDGALGVIYGLEIARAAQEAGDLPVGLDAVSWNDEEGRFGHFLGSRAYRGLVSPDEVDAATDEGGVALRDAIMAAGYHDLPERPIDPARHVAYLEGHIEQGALLEASGLQLAAVDAIVGAKEFLVRFAGESNHAGTAPMALRKDAVRALARFVAALDARYERIADGRVVWTFGRIEVTPNAPSIVPSAASVTVQFRAPNATTLATFEAVMREVLAEIAGVAGVGAGETCLILDYAPTPMDARLTTIIAEAAETTAPGRSRTMPSGAGHDAQFMAPIMPAGMLFIPSIGGISHSFAEDSAEADIVAGCHALARAVSMMVVDGAYAPSHV